MHERVKSLYLLFLFSVYCKSSLNLKAILGFSIPYFFIIFTRWGLYTLCMKFLKSNVRFIAYTKKYKHFHNVITLFLHIITQTRFDRLKRHSSSNISVTLDSISWIFNYIAPLNIYIIFSTNTFDGHENYFGLLDNKLCKDILKFLTGGFKISRLGPV